MELGYYQSQTYSMQQRMHLAIKMSQILDLSQQNYRQTIEELEKTDVFIKLQAGGEEKAISILPVNRYFSPPDSIRALDGAIIQEENNAVEGEVVEEKYEPHRESSPIGQLIKSHPEVFNKVKSMPMDLFRYYFIEGEGTLLELSEFFKAPPEEIQKIRAEINEILITDELPILKTSASDISQEISCEVTAEVFIEGEKVQISYHRERARYHIDENKIQKLIEEERMTPKEQEELKQIRTSMARINTHLDLLYKIVDAAVNAQRLFLSGASPFKTALEEKTLAEYFGVDTSWISRLIQGKNTRRYIKINNRYIPLRDLFITKRELKKQKGMKALCEILNENVPLEIEKKSGEINNTKKNAKPQKITGEKLRDILYQDYKIKAGRRTVNNWRKELEKNRRKQLKKRTDE